MENQQNEIVKSKLKLKLKSTECKKTGDCCLCDGKYKFYGNNAYPLGQGQCCDDCNIIVIEARLS
jgi:hypothetical protein